MAIVVTPEMVLYASLALDAAIRRIFAEYQEMMAEQRTAKIKELEAEKAELDARLQAIINGRSNC